MKEAYFAGGCFWCITPAFRSLDGVQRVLSGYSGGEEASPTYEDVKHQRTGHRETIRVTYDEAVVSFARLTALFLEQTDPFDDGGQFIDRGHSYTLAVYVNDEEEKETVCRQLAALERTAGKPVFVAVEPFRAFWRAEEYHQDYDRKNPEAFAEELETSGRNARDRKKQG